MRPFNVSAPDPAEELIASQYPMTGFKGAVASQPINEAGLTPGTPSFYGPRATGIKFSLLSYFIMLSLTSDYAVLVCMLFCLFC